MPFNVSIVTNCTQRKSECAQADVAQLPHSRSTERLAQSWQRLVNGISPVCSVKSLYQGRTIVDTAAAAAHLAAPWYVISAGLGLKHADQLIPAYECTVASGSELSNRLERAEARTVDWWNAITASQPHPLSRLIAGGTTLLALPGTYLRMVHDDLSNVPAAQVNQLRIFTSSAGAKFVPESLAGCVMPYDDRLESIPGYAGTRSDFAQRALRHFVEALGATPLCLDDARAKVRSSLAHKPRPRRSIGKRMSDDELRQVLITAWDQHDGSSTRLLRYLRDEARISCEQKRFSQIWKSLVVQLRA